MDASPPKDSLKRTPRGTPEQVPGEVAGEVQDEALMQRYQQGDADAFTQLYQRHRPGLFRYLLRSCGDPAVAEEIYQDVWIEVINARLRYQPSAAFGAWLYRIGRNKMIDHLRRAGHPATPGHNEAAVELHPAPPCQVPDLQTQSDQTLSRFRAAMQVLPAEQREAFMLRHERGFGVAEIAEITGVSRETAKSRLRYAMSKLRAAIAEPEVSSQPSPAHSGSVPTSDSDEGSKHG